MSHYKAMPVYLSSIVRMLQAAFAQRPSDEEYFAIAMLLGNLEFSERNVGEALYWAFGGDVNEHI